MKRILTLSGIVTVFAIGMLLGLTHEEAHAHGTTRYDPCICYTYYSDGTIETGYSCDQPSLNGACAKLLMCLPKNKEDQ